jgi:putative endonuclease
MDAYHCVYILESLSNPNQIYTGQTQELKQRLKEHNSGRVSHTLKFTPWHIRSATAFKDRERALAFERYLNAARAAFSETPSLIRLVRQSLRASAGFGPANIHFPHFDLAGLAQERKNAKFRV